MKEQTKKWIIIAISVFLAIVLFQVVRKALKTGAKAGEVVFNVGSMPLAVTDISEIVEARGVAEGDPQVKVYPQVPGKFDSNAVFEGQEIKRDAVLSYINRDMVGFNYQLAPVKSPVSGIVTKLYYVDKGAAVSPQYPIAEVANPDFVKVTLSFGEQELLKVKKDSKAMIEPVYNGGKLEGSVFSVTPFIDRDTLAGTVIVRAKNQERLLKPGTSVRVKIFTGERKGFMVVENAVLMGEGKTYIYINEAGKAKRVDVKTGYSTDGQVEIMGEIKEGDQLVTEGNFKLNEGAKIKTEQGK